MKPRLHAPKFWHKPSLLGTLLSPLGKLYGMLSGMMQSQAVPFRTSIPVFCVGNVTLGGAGKTPVTLAITELLHNLKETPHLLSRGYGASVPHPILVDPSRDTPGTVGDEPLILARHAPTWVHANRANSAKRAVTEGASVLVLDDGLQHSSLIRDTCFLVIDTDYGLGNGHIFPAGPLRETLDAALHKSHAIIALGNAPLRLPVTHNLPVFRAVATPTPEWEILRNQIVFPFAGLANNSKFFRMCESVGMRITDRASLPDHHIYTRDEAKLLIHRANLLGAIPVTTEKDAVKLHPDERKLVHVLPVTLTWENRMELLQFLITRIADFRNAPPSLMF